MNHKTSEKFKNIIETKLFHFEDQLMKNDNKHERRWEKAVEISPSRIVHKINTSTPVQIKQK